MSFESSIKAAAQEARAEVRSMDEWRRFFSDLFACLGGLLLILSSLVWVV